MVSELIGEKKAAVKVLRSTDKWYGVTYREDKPVVVEASPKRRPTAFTRKISGLNLHKNTAGTASQPYFYLYWMPNPLKESGYSSSSCSSRLLRERLF